jgi:hypothetical protein
MQPWFRCIQYTFICPTVSASDLENEFRKSPPDIVVLKHHPQINFKIEPFYDIAMSLSKACFHELHKSATYSVYKKTVSSKSSMNTTKDIR